MGNLQNIRNNVIPTYMDPESMPDISKPSKFDPLLGFPNGRKERPLPQVSLEEMMAAKVPERKRDYCADKYIALKKCHYEYTPFVAWYCQGLKHEYFKCEEEDHTLRLKEYEREKRLLARARRLKMQQ